MLTTTEHGGQASWWQGDEQRWEQLIGFEQVALQVGMGSVQLVRWPLGRVSTSFLPHGQVSTAFGLNGQSAVVGE